jgi:divalent metal cation (Fe/Co/Zn/Cd) transporter
MEQGTSYFGFSIADPLGGLIVAGQFPLRFSRELELVPAMITKQGVSMFLSSLYELLDASADPSLAAKLQDLCTANEPSIQSVRSVKAFKSGPVSRVEIEAAVAHNLTVAKLLDLERRLQVLVQEYTKGEVTEVVLRPR